MGLFISYSSLDKAATEPLRTALRHARQQVWMDEELGGGEVWWRTILEQIRSCEVFIVALSNNSLASKPCQAELRYAQALQRQILPVQVGPVTSLRVTPFATTQIINFVNPSADSGGELIAAVHELRAQLQPLPSELPEEPPVPFAYLMRLANNIAEPQLSVRQQTVLVSELKNGLEEDGDDPAARSDIKHLLCMLRDRPDVAWRVRTDIESVLASVDAKPSTVTAEGVAAQNQDFENRSDQPGPLAPSAQPGLASGPTTQHQAALLQPATSSGSQPEPEGKRGPPRKWIMLAGTGLAVVAAIVVVVMTVFKPSAPPLRMLTSDDLDDVLLNDAEINSIMNAYDMGGSLMGREAIEPTFTVSPPDCLGVFWAGLAPVFSPSGYTALHYLKFQEPGNDPEHFVTEATAVFPSADRASAFVASSTDNWARCAGQTLTQTDKADSTKTEQWTVGTLSQNAPEIEQKITKVHSEKNGDPWVCGRALRPVSNVVIDVRACGYHISDQADRSAEKIAVKVTQ